MDEHMIYTTNEVIAIKYVIPALIGTSALQDPMLHQMEQLDNLHDWNRSKNLPIGETELCAPRNKCMPKMNDAWQSIIEFISKAETFFKCHVKVLGLD